MDVNLYKNDIYQWKIFCKIQILPCAVKNMHVNDLKTQKTATSNVRFFRNFEILFLKYENCFLRKRTSNFSSQNFSKKCDFLAVNRV